MGTGTGAFGTRHVYLTGNLPEQVASPDFNGDGTSGTAVAREARAIFPETVVPRDFDLIELPFQERGGPELVKRGARLPRAEVPSGA